MATAADLEPVSIPQGDYFSKAQVARLKGVDPSTVQQWIDKGWLTAIRVGNLGYLISQQELENFVPKNYGPRFMRRG